MNFLRLILLSLLLTGPAFAQGTTNLLVWYKLDDGSGTVAADCSNLGNTGNLSNAPAWTTGQWGGGIFSDYGYSQYVQGPTITPMGATNKLTMAVWMKLGYNNSYMAVGCATTPVSADNIQIQVQPGPYVYFKVGNQYAYNSAPSDLGWHHYAFVFDGTLAAASRMKAYVDGVLLTGIGYTGFSSMTATPAAGPFYVGRDRAYNEYSYGYFDDVRVYSTALTDADILSLYNNGSLDGCLNAVIKTRSRVRYQ